MSRYPKPFLLFYKYVCKLFLMHVMMSCSGYIAPEYAVDGSFSVKSDAFSFGILALEIVCGKRNRGLNQTDKSLNVVGCVRA